ncbi:hypothetical protein GCM10022224_059750 [Nonomuraea antimicrobica]|uniref:DUF1795 domain-containing protein n=1 Tax=Nonomuraea antimicrobica TaxID=561173 RepID=A0ABP7CF61_9ACTN
MEDDHRVWPPQSRARHRRRTSQPYPDASLQRDRWARDVPDPVDRDPVERHPRERAIPESPDPDFWGEERGHPLDLPADDGPSWNPRIRGTVPGGPVRSGEPWDELPPSARLHGSPADPHMRVRAAGTSRVWRRAVVVLVSLAAGTAVVAGATALAARLTAPAEEAGRLSDALAGVAATLPQGWSVEPVPPVTGFTSVARHRDGALVMARPMPGPVEDAKKAAAEAGEQYSRLLLKGDRVTVVEDRAMPGGHTRALRAEYQDVVNRPAFLRVMLLTRATRPVLLVGLLQPEENSRRQALDALMTSLR